MTAVLVTGGTGFLGRRLVRALRAAGCDVHVLARPGSVQRRALLEREIVDAQVVTGDVLDPASLAEALADVAVVFHLAGRLLEPGVPEAEYRRLHVEGTRNLLEACRRQARIDAIVHCSTTGVLGPTGHSPASEDAPLQPSNAYERSKAEAERLALDAAARDGLPLCVARPALVYGPGDLHLLRWFRAIRDGRYRVVGHGDNLLHPVYVDDVVEGLLRCSRRCDTRRAARCVYHLVGDQPLPIRKLAAEIARALGTRLPRAHIPRTLALATGALLERVPGLEPARLPLTRDRVAFMTESRAYSGARARSELGFVPCVGLQAGLQTTVDWYRREGLL